MWDVSPNQLGIITWCTEGCNRLLAESDAASDSLPSSTSSLADWNDRRKLQARLQASEFALAMEQGLRINGAAVY